MLCHRLLAAGVVIIEFSICSETGKLIDFCSFVGRKVNCFSLALAFDAFEVYSMTLYTSANTRFVSENVVVKLFIFKFIFIARPSWHENGNRKTLATILY